MRRRRLIGVVFAAALAAVLVAGCRGGESATPGAGEGADLSGSGFSTAGWKTDFSRHSVPLSEFHSGGPPRDGIPPIDEPRFVPEAEVELPAREPVIAVEIGGQARAYPIRIMIWHEIVNDTLAGVPIAVTFCPLCHTALAFERTLAGRELTFGTTGNLRFSDLVMWDRQTESWWQQFSGEAVVGELTGARLEPVAAQLVSYAEFRDRYPRAPVLSEDTGHRRPYGRNPYTGYDDADTPPFLLRDREPDGRLAPKARVVSVDAGGEMLAVPFEILAERPVVEARAGERPVVIWWRPGVASALGPSEIAAGDDAGGVVVYEARAGGRPLSFALAGERLRDAQTGSEWDRSGRAVAGPLEGRRLRPVAHDTPFWFAVAAFRPDVRIVGDGS